MKKIGFLAAVLTGMLLTGCGSGPGQDISGNGNTARKTLTAATEGMVRPISYTDKNGQLTGYEVEVLKAIGKETGYDIRFEKTEFASMFAGIDSGRYQIGFGNLGKTAEREMKYTYTTVPHYYEPAGFFVTKGLLKIHPIRTIEDLGGLKTDSNSKGDSWQQFVEAYNKKFPDHPIQVSYSDEDWGAYYQRLDNGTINLLKGVESRMKIYADEYGYQYDYVGLPQPELDRANGLADPNHWLIFPKTEEGRLLAEQFDNAITKLQKDGTLSQISLQFLGKDYSSRENYEANQKSSGDSGVAAQ